MGFRIESGGLVGLGVVGATFGVSCGSRWSLSLIWRDVGLGVEFRLTGPGMLVPPTQLSTPMSGCKTDP